MRWGILERGISGDLDGSMSDEERTRKTVETLAQYVNEMTKGRWPELVPMALTVLQDLAKAEGEDRGGGPAGDEHLAALEHFRVPGASQIQDDDQPDQQWQGGPPDSESGALAGAYLRGHAERRQARQIVQTSLLDGLDEAGEQ